MPSLKTLVQRLGHYASATAVPIVCGLISYPLFTRKLAIEDYGTLALIQVMIATSIAVTKLGLQNSIVRLWPVYDRDEAGRASLGSTYFYAALALGVIGLCIFGVLAFALHRSLPARMLWPLAAAALLVPIRTLASCAQNFLRARERSRLYAGLAAAGAGAGLIATTMFVLVLMPPRYRLVGFFLGGITAEAALLAPSLRGGLQGIRVRPQAFSWALLRDGVWFGAPLMLFEVSTLALMMGDRVIIHVFWNDVQLGLYAAAFSLALQVATVFTSSVELALVPMYTNLYEREGAAATRAFLARGLRLYYLVALPMIAGLWAVRSDLIEVLASRKYADAKSLVPVLLAGFLIFGSRSFFGAGLFIGKRTRVTGSIACGGAVLNLALNLVLVPRYGIMGSAAATALSLLLVVGTIAVWSRRLLPFDLSVARFGLYAAGAALMALAAHAVTFVPPHQGTLAQHGAQLVVRVATGVVVYGTFALAVEPELRRGARRVLGRLRARRARAAAHPGPAPGRVAAISGVSHKPC
jgi:O-antigen/teichoic acid export membrane protein